MNMQIAETSVKVAKASQLESKAMREIAEDSRKIADATAKDSAAMRTISFITMVLLPATSSSYDPTLFEYSLMSYR